MTSNAERDKSEADSRTGHVLVACDRYVGTLSARDVATCIANGLRAVAPGIRIIAGPVADGGDGTLIAVEEAGFESVPSRLTGRPEREWSRGMRHTSIWPSVKLAASG